MIDTRNYLAADALKDGTMVTVRAIRAEDRETLLAAFAALDRESIYTRFFTHKKELTETELMQLAEVDSDHVVALVVTLRIDDGEKLLGGGRYCSGQPLSIARSAELAFVTADAQHGRGIASLVLRHLVLIARDQGLQQLEADVLAHNQPMLAVFRRSGLAMTQQRESSVIHIRLAI
jgi:RimJ/RimL family protein N-acetyltransferase